MAPKTPKKYASFCQYTQKYRYAIKESRKKILTIKNTYISRKNAYKQKDRRISIVRKNTYLHANKHIK